MSGGLVFDDDLAAQLDVVYRTRDIVRRRRLVHEALAARPGERILDVGCGPGFYVAEILEAVGAEGSVVGLDSSPGMLATAARRTEGRANAAFHEADATSLPVEDEGFDAAVSVQVLEYVPDVDLALAEIRRALRPGGRVVLWDIDWTTVSWHSEDPARMARVLAAWDDHLAHVSLPATLADRLRRAGFEDVSVEAHVFMTAELVPDAYAGAIFPLVESFVAERGIEEAEASAWADEQRALDERGAFYFACTQLCFTARRS